jgi:hypothetical protein
VAVPAHGRRGVIYLAFAFFILDLVLLDRWMVERRHHHLTRAALRYWRKHSIMPAASREQMP